MSIVLESDGSEFKVQSALLCHASDYFVKACQGPFKEAEERTLRIPGCDADVFKFFLYWLCERELPSFWAEHDISEEPACRWAKLLMRLCVFADACLVTTLENDAIYELLRLLRDGYGRTLDMVYCAYKIAPAGSRVREIYLTEALHIYMMRMQERPDIGPHQFQSFARHPELVVDFMEALAKGVSENYESSYGLRTHFKSAWDEYSDTF